MSKSTCPVCASPVTRKGKAGPLATYCTTACRNRAAYLRRRAAGKIVSQRSTGVKSCPECSESFVPAKTAKQTFCSKRCAKRNHNRRFTKTKPVCKYENCSNKSVSSGLCRKHHPKGVKWSRGLPETRRANLRRRTQRRRAMTRDPNAELIDRDQIGDRDGWRCGLCSQFVDRRLEYPHPSSASLDHIEPLSLGGLHVRSNVQIAHLGCNIAKGNRGVGEQLLLIG